MVRDDQSIKRGMRLSCILPLECQLPPMLRSSTEIDDITLCMHFHRIWKREKIARTEGGLRYRAPLRGSAEQGECLRSVLALEALRTPRCLLGIRVYPETLIPISPGKLLVDWSGAHPPAQTLPPVEQRDATQLTHVPEDSQESRRRDSGDAATYDGCRYWRHPCELGGPIRLSMNGLEASRSSANFLVEFDPTDGAFVPIIQIH